MLCYAMPLSLDYYVQVRGGQLWGTDVYTYDSDLVAGTCSYLLQKDVVSF